MRKLVQYLPASLFVACNKLTEHPKGLLHKHWFLSHNHYHPDVVVHAKKDHRMRTDPNLSIRTLYAMVCGILEDSSFRFSRTNFLYKQNRLFTCPIGGVVAVNDRYIEALGLTDCTTIYSAGPHGHAVFTADPDSAPSSSPMPFANTIAIIATCEPPPKEELQCLVSGAAQN